MENEQIVDALELLVKLWDVHGINEFKSKNLSFAARGLDKYPGRIANLDLDALYAIPGVGKVVVQIVQDIAQTGTCADLEAMIEQTPPGILDILKIKGLGPKKVGVIWRELGISELDHLLAACHANQLEQLKGFGKAIQENVSAYILFLKENRRKLRLDKAEKLSMHVLDLLRPVFPELYVAGELSRNCEVISSLVFIVQTADMFSAHGLIEGIEGMQTDFQQSSPFTWRGYLEGHLIPIEIHLAEQSQATALQFQLGSNPEHLALVNYFQQKNIVQIEEVYRSQNLPFIVPEMREGFKEFEWSIKHQPADLVQLADLTGCLHNHSTYSDGKNSLLEMAEACRALGLTYFGIADHSQYAAYAGGLKEEDVIRQHAEIDALNQTWDDFQILKGIEADILPDGSLDYNDRILASFDYVVASVHAQLVMDQDRAMGRLIKAIENPYTNILGHPTGRLLLTRSGYPIDTNKILDACKANGVSIELNASPYRLDLDWRHIYEAMEKGVYVSINPDAHKIEGLKDMEYGVRVGRKGGLLKSLTLNALPLNELKAFFSKT
jgi:DNA polymerase (family 10)